MGNIGLTRFKRNPGRTRQAGLFTRKRQLFFSLLVAVVAFSSVMFTSLAANWASTIAVGSTNNGYQPIYNLAMKVRPTDGVAFIVGSSGGGTGAGNVPGQAIAVIRADQPNTFLCGGDCDDSSTHVTHSFPQLFFANDGTGYFVFRHYGSNYQAYLRPMQPNGNFLPGIDIGATFAQAGGGGILDFPDGAYNHNSGKIGIVGEVQLLHSSDSNAPVNGAGYGELNANGQTWSNLHLFTDKTGQAPDNKSGLNALPHLCYNPTNNDAHVIYYAGNGSVYTDSRINGVWQTPFDAADSGNYGGFQFRGPSTIACGADGYAYAMWDSGASFGMAVFNPTVNTWQFLTNDRIPGMNTGTLSAVITPDNTLYVGAGAYVNCGCNFSTGSGMAVYSSINHGQSFSGPQIAINFSASDTDGVGIDYSAVNGKLQVAADFAVERRGFYNYAVITSAPAAPTNLIATAVSGNQINLTWTNSTSDTSNIIHVERQSTGGDFVDIGTAAAGAASYSDTTASPDTTYAYRIRYLGPAGASPYSNTATATTLPGAPVNLTATATSFNSIQLNWNNTSPGATIHVQRQTNSGAFSELGTFSAGATTYTDTGLAYNTTYGYRLYATDANGTSGFSNTATATTLPIATISIDTGPGNVGVNTTINPIKITIHDSTGAAITNYSGSVTVTKSAGPGSLHGSFTQAINSSGSATFSDLTIDTIGTGNVLTFNVSGITVSTAAFAVYGKLVFVTQPSNVLVNQGMSSSVVVKVVRPGDTASANAVSYSGIIQLSIAPGTGPAGAKINGNTTYLQPASSGIVTFTNVSIDTLNANYQLLAAPVSSDPLYMATSNPFTVGAKLVITNTSPQSVQATQPFTVTVNVEDFSSTVITGYNGLVTLSPNGNTGAFYGGRSTSAQQGVAVFSGLSVNQSSGSFTITATIPSLGSVSTALTLNATSGPSCDPLLVNSTSETGDDVPSCNITLRGAVGRATAGQVVQLSPVIASSGITLTQPLTLTHGVTLQGICGQAVTIYTTPTNDLILGGANHINGLTVIGARIVSTGTTGNVFTCFKQVIVSQPGAVPAVHKNSLGQIIEDKPTILYVLYDQA